MTNKDLQFNLKIHASFEWLKPPENQSEIVMRQQANIIAQVTANKLTEGVRLICLEMLNERIK